MPDKKIVYNVTRSYYNGLARNFLEPGIWEG